MYLSDPWYALTAYRAVNATCAQITEFERQTQREL